MLSINSRARFVKLVKVYGHDTNFSDNGINTLKQQNKFKTNAVASLLPLLGAHSVVRNDVFLY